MSFIFRESKPEDLNSLFDLAKQFSLLNLPPDKKKILEKIELSQASCAGEVVKEKACYLFVVEDQENKRVAGSSQIVAKHGTEDVPTYSFKLLKKEQFSKALGVGFIHQILRLTITTDGPTELGGLVVDKSYRRRPERIGKWASLGRFLYIKKNLEAFQAELHSEMAPPLTEEGRSEFWEALGRRFTGMPYQEADELSHSNKEFIESLFPKEDIYLALLDAKARLVLGQVGQETVPALNLLQKQGFVYKSEVDPFDGGPHLGVNVNEVTMIKSAKELTVASLSQANFKDWIYVAIQDQKGFRCDYTVASIEGDKVSLPQKSIENLNIQEGVKVLTAKG